MIQAPVKTKAARPADAYEFKLGNTTHGCKSLHLCQVHGPHTSSARVTVERACNRGAHVANTTIMERVLMGIRPGCVKMLIAVVATINNRECRCRH